jgi:5-methylcytosine-specific restriction endonuclease McrA
MPAYKYKYTEKQLREAIAASRSLRQVMLRLGIVAEGSNYRTIRKRIAALNLDIGHFTGKGWRRNAPRVRKRDLQVYLDNQIPIPSSRLRKRLIEEGLKKAQCEKCKRKTWLGQPIPLELDHIDGDHANNHLANLQVLCPNCHAFTPNYRGRNIQRSA